MTLTIPDKIDARNVVGYGNPDYELNLMDLEILKLPPRECPLIHKFTPGMYIREIYMPKDTILTTLLHLTTHPFFIMKGDVTVWYHGIPAHRYKTGYSGITEAGTRRMLATHKDTIWTTCHVTDLTDPDEIIDSITSRDFNPHIAKEDPRVQKWRHNRTDLIK